MDSHQRTEGTWVEEWMRGGYLQEEKDFIEMDAKGLSELHRRFGGGREDSDDSSLYEPNQTSSSSTYDSDESDYELKPEQKEKPSRSKTNYGKQTVVKQRFKYNGRIFLTSLPGMVLLLILAGDLLITVLAVGTLLVYLFHVAENRDRATESFLVTFMCALLSVVYSGVPFLWKSVFNTLLVINLVALTVLLGGWLYISLPVINVEDKDLVQFLEASLFTLHPIVSVFLVTWVCVSVTSLNTAPYCLMVIGFAVLQIFLSPTLTSFHKHSRGDSLDHYILKPPVTAGIITVFSFFIPNIFLIIQGHNGSPQLLSFATLVELVFIFCSCCFLATYFNLSQCLDFFGVDISSVHRLRLIMGVCALIPLGPVLAIHNFHSTLVSWVPAASVLVVIYGLMLSRKQKVLGVASAAVFLLVFSGLVFSQFPWHFNFSIGNLLSVRLFYVCVVAHCVLGLVTVYSSVYMSNDILGLLLLAESFCLLCMEYLLLAGENYSISSVVTTSTVGCYLLLKLYYSNKLLWQHVWLSLATLVTKCLVVMDILVPEVPLGGTRQAFDHLLCWSFVLVICYVFFFNQKTNHSVKEVCVQAIAVVLTTSINTPGLIRKLLVAFVHEEPSLSALAGAGGLLVCSCWVKWCIDNEEVKKWSLLMLPVCLISCLMLLILQPELSLSLLAVEQWLVVISLACILAIVNLAKPSRSDKRIASELISVLAVPVGLALCINIFPQDCTWQLCGMYGIGAAVCTDIALQAWRQTSQYDQKILRSAGVAVVVALLALLCDAVAEFSADTSSSVSPGLLLATIMSVTIAVILKLWSKSGQMSHLSKEGLIRRSVVPLIGNTAVVCGFLLSSFCYQLSLDLWICICSTELLLFQRDHLVLHSLTSKNHFTPSLTVVIACLEISTLIQSTLWQSKGTLAMLSGGAECVIIAVTAPLMIVFVLVTWRGIKENANTDKLAAFLGPLFLLLFLLASSRVTMVLAGTGIIVALWLVFYAPCVCHSNAHSHSLNS